jgi:hypothetical protein
MYLAVSGYTPSSFHNSEVSTNFYLNASVAITGTTIQCAWYSPALVYEYTSATVTAGTQATCKTPATLAVGTWTVSIRIDNILFTNPIPIPIYDCSNPAPNGCVSCLSSAARPKCLWCDSTLSCNLQSAFGSCSSVISSSNTCPTVKALPDTDTIFGGRTIQLTPSVPVPVPSPTSVQCDFSGYVFWSHVPPCRRSNYIHERLASVKLLQYKSTRHTTALLQQQTQLSRQPSRLQLIP